MKENRTIRTYRGFKIEKHDTGARRMGRDISYTIIDEDGSKIGKFLTLKQAKITIDWQLDSTEEQREQARVMREKLLAELLKETK